MPGEVEDKIGVVSLHNKGGGSRVAAEKESRGLAAGYIWSLVPALALIPLLAELIDAYSRKVWAFSDPYDWESVAIRTGLLAVVAVYICLKASEREKVLSVLQGSESLYRGLFENSRDPIAVATTDGRLLDANEAFTSLFGYASDELKDFDMLQLYVDPVDRSKFREEIESLGSVKDFEVRLRKKDRSEIDCELSGTLRRDGDGSILGYQTIVRDVTERKQAEQARRRMHAELEEKVRERTEELVKANNKLRQEMMERERVETEHRLSEERFRAVFESAQDCIFMKDRNLRYTHVNPAMLRLVSLPANGIVGLTDEAIFGSQAGKNLREIELRVLQGQTIEAEESLPLREGYVIVNCIRSPMRDSKGSTVGIYGIARDMTDRRGKETETISPPGSYGSRSMTAVLDQLLLASKTDSIVLLLGESGTGKDYLARYLHDNSNLAGSPFFAINCAALPVELAESELFGHEAGAFTGARGRKRGLLELAEGGTLLLNEIGDLPLHLQAKLLSFLDTRSFTRVGGEKSVEVNTRLIAATNRDLEREVAAGNFREDLFYRLNVFTVRVPPLRHRMEDLPHLVTDLLASLAKRMGVPETLGVDHAVLDALAEYHWPGNVRELRNVLERALILSDKKRIMIKDVGKLNTSTENSGEHADLSFSVSISKGQSLREALREAERGVATEALRRSGGSVKNAARELGISRDQMKYLMKSLGIRRNIYPEVSLNGVSFTRH